MLREDELRCQADVQPCSRLEEVSWRVRDLLERFFARGVVACITLFDVLESSLHYGLSCFSCRQVSESSAEVVSNAVTRSCSLFLGPVACRFGEFLTFGFDFVESRFDLFVGRFLRSNDSADHAIGRRYLPFHEIREVQACWKSWIRRCWIQLLPLRSIERLRVIQFCTLELLGFLVEQAACVLVLVADLLTPSHVFWPVYWLLDVVFLMPIDFVRAWIRTRESRKLVLAFPSIVLSLVVVIPFLLRDRNSERIRHYEMALLRAEEHPHGKQGESELLRNKLRQLGAQRVDDLEYEAAINLARRGDLQRAYERLRRIAPLDSPRHLEAHLWIARSLCDGRLGHPNRIEHFKKHLDCALILDPSNPQSQRLSVELLLLEREFDQAIQSMLHLVKRYPDFHATLAHVYRHHSGDEQRARFHARRAILDYRLASDAKSAAASLTPLGYTRLAECYALLDERRSELDLLRRAVVRYPKQGSLRGLLVRCLQRQIFEVEFTDSEFSRLALLLSRENFGNEVLRRKVVQGLTSEDLTVVRATRRAVCELMEAELLDAGSLKAVGDFYYLKSDHQLAARYYSRACDVDPQSSAALNNLAVIWSESGKLETALPAANRAIALSPDPTYFETRGQIHIKLEQWEAACLDLEAALNGGVSNVLAIHQSLALANERIGRTEKAEAHRRIVSKLSQSRLSERQLGQSSGFTSHVVQSGT